MHRSMHRPRERIDAHTASPITAFSTLDEHRVISVRASVPVFSELAQPSDRASRSSGALPESPTPLAVHCSQPSDRTGRLSMADTTAAATHVYIGSELIELAT